MLVAVGCGVLVGVSVGVGTTTVKRRPLSGNDSLVLYEVVEQGETDPLQGRISEGGVTATAHEGLPHAYSVPFVM